MIVLFAGTPQFAVPTLEALIDSNHQVASVITMPDRPKGRGRKPAPPPVKVVADGAGIPVLQPEKLLRSIWEKPITDIAPDVAVVVAYGKILRRWFLDIPPTGVVNVHASLLPKHRGPGPIERAILDGDAETGITTMMIDEGVDTGDMLLTERTRIGDEETAGDLAERLSRIGAELLVQTLDLLEEGRCPRSPQDHSLATHAPMLEKSVALIDWQTPADHVARQVRAMNPRPVAWTPSSRGVLRVYRASVVDRAGTPGTVLAADPSQGLVIAAAEGAVRLGQVQLPGKRRMDDVALLTGATFPVGRPLGATGRSS